MSGEATGPTISRELALALRTLYHEESQRISLDRDPSVVRHYTNLRRVVKIIDRIYPPKETRPADRAADNR